MIDLTIFELLATIAIGTVVSITIIYFYFLTAKLMDIKKHKTDNFAKWFTNFSKKEHKQTGFTLIATILVFTIGLITQDLTDHLADSEKSKNPIINFIKERKILATEGELRLESLLNNQNELNELGKDVFRNYAQQIDSTKSFIIHTGTDSITIHEAVSNWESYGLLFSDENNKIILIKYANNIYYDAKNWCFLKSEPIREELKDIQTRIDMSRSFTIISFIAIILIIIVYLVYYTKEIIKGKNRFKIITKSSINKKQTKTITQKKFFFPTYSILIFISAFFICKLAYQVAENNYNERAYGYYITHLELQENKEE